MKYFATILLFFLPHFLFSQGIIIGSNTLKELLTTDHKAWFDKNYNEYQPDMTVIQTLPVSKNISVKIVGGTWCSDTRLHLPAFYKAIDLWQFDHQSIEIIFVNRSKQIKLKSYKKLNITLVPTFIFYDAKGKEMGRIVETPIQTIERDMLQILSEHNK